ncbi:MAG: OmpA family protein [Cytophagales bacterium]
MRIIINRFCSLLLFLSVFASGLAQVKKSKIDTVNYKLEFLNINSDNDDFSPSFYKDGLLFCSDREKQIGVIYKSETTDKPLIDIYYTTSIAGDKFKKPKAFTKSVNSHNSEGPLTFTKDYNKVYFTRNDIVNGESLLRIYLSRKNEKEEWSEARMVSFGSEKYSYGHPAIAPSGDFIIFASNMAGGFGGTDLYISYLKEGKWSKPANLGKPINSNKNEITPYMHEKGVLYFASDRLGGQGGLDMYFINYNNFEWTGLKNMGYPINSSYNDFGLIMNPDFSRGYLSSNRRNGEDDDDIYSISTAEDLFKNCDTLKKSNLCRTFYEEGTIPTQNSPLVYEWEMGDGTKKRGNEVRHCYQKPGNYNIQLNVVDLISDQVLINEATFDLTIDSIKGPHIQSLDTAVIGLPIAFDGSKSKIADFTISKYAWDYGNGQTFYGDKSSFIYHAEGSNIVRMNLTYTDADNVIKNVCVFKNIDVLTPETLAKLNNTMQKKEYDNSDLKKLYNIKDSEGNVYKIQIATSKKPIGDKFKKFEGVLKVDEYYDRNVYAYTVGNFNNALEAYPKLKMLRKIGFKEAVVIAQNDNKLISGSDSSFFVEFEENMVPIKVVTQRGRILDKDGNLLEASVSSLNLVTDEFLGEIKCNSPLGSYELNFPDGELYAYSVSMKGFFPYSSNLDLRKENTLANIEQDIVLYTAKQLSNINKPIKVSNLFFESESYKIQPESYQELDRIADFMKENYNEEFEILGHTDHIGNAQSNLQLSQKRADEVASYLIKKGVSPNIIFTKGLGNSEPVSANAKLIELNRRVEIKIKPHD